MDAVVSIEVLTILLTVALHVADGFSIRGHTRPNQGRHQEPWNADIDAVREMTDRINDYANYQQQSQTKSQQQQQQQPEEELYDQRTPFLYDTFSSLDGRSTESNKDASISFSRNQDGMKFINDLPDTDDPSNANNDDKIDVFATISYPKNVAPILDNLSLSTKIGLLKVPAKRQQGWYVQYGKRSQGTDSSPDNIPSSDSINANEVRSISETSDGDFPIQPSGDLDNINHDAEDSSKIELNLELRRNLERFENDVNVNNLAYDIVRRILEEKSKDLPQPSSFVKRQQAWFTQYGKRNGDAVPDSFSSSSDLRRSLERLKADLNVRDLTYDIVKSVLEGDSKEVEPRLSPAKRQQGWYTPHGKKRSDGVSGSFT